MEDRIIKILYDELEKFHPEFKVKTISIDDNLSKILPFTSFEWMVIIFDIETTLNIRITSNFYKERTIRSLIIE